MTVHITELLATRDRFRAVLAAAQEQRGQRPDVITLPDGDREFEWVLFERQKMFAEVNQVRAEQGLPLVEMGSVERVERQACGHVDYSQKFAFYCSELALGVKDPRE